MHASMFYHKDTSYLHHKRKGKAKKKTKQNIEEKNTTQSEEEKEVLNVCFEGSKDLAQMGI